MKYDVSTSLIQHQNGHHASQLETQTESNLSTRKDELKFKRSCDDLDAVIQAAKTPANEIKEVASYTPTEQMTTSKDTSCFLSPSVNKSPSPNTLVKNEKLA